MPEEGEILVPPPPSTAPPPPPGTFILPPPDFMGELTEPVYMTPSMVEEDFSLLKPPPMAPPKPPSVCSSGSTSSLPVSGPPDTVPEPPKFAAPQPPSERQTKTSKTPPPKPIRLSSMTNLIDSPPQTPAPPPPVQTPTLSTFNPQNTAKIYNMPKTSILKYENQEQRPKQILLLEDSVKPAPAPAQVDGKGPKTVPQPKPVPKDVRELKDRLDVSSHSPSPLPEPKKEVKTVTLSSSLENGKPLRTPTQASPQIQKAENSSGVIPEPSKDKPEKSPSQGHRFSPLLERKLRNLKIGENNAPREGHAASPLALLMAAKERDKHRSNHLLSQENSYTKNEQPRASIHPSDSSPNSFTVTPRSISSPSLTPTNILQENNKSANIVTPSQNQTSPQSASPALAKDQTLPSSLTRMAKSQSTTNLVIQPQSTQRKDDKEDLNVPFIPPPPEFDDLDEVVEPPPSILPPDPPTKKAATQNISFLSPAPPLSPKPKPPQLPKPPPPPQAPKPPPPEAPKLPPPEAPKLPPPEAPRLPTPVSKPKPQVQTKPKVASNQLPSALSPSQATLLSILQKKMLEMDHKMASVKETESSSDDWGTPSSEENNKVPVVPKATPPSKNGPAVNKAAALDMKELEGKMAKRFHETSSVKIPTR